MKRYFLAPRSGEKSYKNFVSTIKHGVPYKQIESHLAPAGKDVLRNEEVIYSWGNREGKRSEWLKMNTGDVVIFYASGDLVMAGNVIYKEYNPDLALAMWPPDDHGQPWSYTFFLNNLRYFRIPLEHFNLASGYKFRSVQGFQEINEPYRTKILDLYKDFDSLFATFSDENSNEQPKEDERVYINVSDQVHPTLSQKEVVAPKEWKPTSGQKKKRKGFVDFDELNKHRSKIGSLGEQVVIRYEKQILISWGRPDLAEKVRHLSLEDTYAGFDVLSFDENGGEKMIEVKATTIQQPEDFSFRISRNEKQMAETNENYHIYLVYDVNGQTPKIHILKNPFGAGSQLVIEPSGFIVKGRFSREP